MRHAQKRFHGKGTFRNSITVLSIDDSANEGPSVNVERHSASPDVSDSIGGIPFIGKDSAGNRTTYAKISGAIVDPTDASEDGQLRVEIIVAGVATDVAFFRAGLQMGSPAGGDKGVGTINTAGDIYKNNSAYANPDYVFEHYYTGQIVKFKDNPGASEYKGLPSLQEVKAHTELTYKLPGFSDKPAGAFERFDMLLEKLEQAYLYIFELETRLSKLEGQKS